MIKLELWRVVHQNLVQGISIFKICRCWCSRALWSNWCCVWECEFIWAFNEIAFWLLWFPEDGVDVNELASCRICTSTYTLQLTPTSAIISDIIKKKCFKIYWCCLAMYNLSGLIDWFIVFSNYFPLWQVPMNFPTTWRHAFVSGFVNYKNGAVDSQPQMKKLTSCLPKVGGYPIL
jgi:hypothetical protein